MAGVELRERPGDREDLGRWYAAALAAQESSGLSVAELAEELGVSASTLYHWRRRLAGSMAEEGGRSASRGGLVEVTVERQPGACVAGWFTVHLSRERSIEVPQQFDDGALRRLVVALESC